tara:strand:- start:399 stop:500 length:102 start_codon:yes stop_codon:yes gene_type:complete
MDRRAGGARRAIIIFDGKARETTRRARVATGAF